jgi:hypothetical protein
MTKRFLGIKAVGVRSEWYSDGKLNRYRFGLGSAPSAIRFDFKTKTKTKEKGTWKNPDLSLRLVRIDVSFCGTECLRAQLLWVPVC